MVGIFRIGKICPGLYTFIIQYVHLLYYMLQYMDDIYDIPKYTSQYL